MLCALHPVCTTANMKFKSSIITLMTLLFTITFLLGHLTVCTGTLSSALLCTLRPSTVLLFVLVIITVVIVTLSTYNFIISFTKVNVNHAIFFPINIYYILLDLICSCFFSNKAVHF